MTNLSRLAWIGGALVAFACSSEVTPPPPPSVALVQITPGADTLTAFGATEQLSAVVKDAAGNVLTGHSVTWSSNASGVAAVNASGLVTAVGNGAASIQASADGVNGSAQVFVAQLVSSVTVTPGTMALTSVGATQQYTAAPKDANNNAVTGVKLLWISSDPGVATIDTLGLATAHRSGQTTITAAAQGLPGYATLSVAQNATALAFRVSPPATTVAGEPFAVAVQVEVRDANGNVVSDAQVPITLAASSNTLKGTRTVNSVNGVASFSGLWMETTGGAYTIGASTGGLTGATSAAYAITFATAAKVAYTSSPVTDTAGALMGVVAEIRDRFGNTVTNATNSVRARLRDNPASGALFGDTVLSAVAGVANFATMNLHKAGTGYTLRVTTAGLDSALSDVFNVTPAHAYKLVLPEVFGMRGGSPANLNTSNYDVHVQDHLDNEVTAGSHPVTLALDTIPFAPASFSGTLTRGSTGGVASFDDITIDRPSNWMSLHYVIVATAPGLQTGRGNANVGMGQIYPFGQVPPMAGGLDHTCGISMTQAPIVAFCWGANAAGQLGNPAVTAPLDSAPVLSAPGEALLEITAGDAHTCALTVSNTALCWGANDQGQLGSNAASGSTPLPVSGGPYFNIAAGSNHTCALKAADSTAVCWGDNASGQLGDNTAPTDQPPVAVSGGRKYFIIVAGGQHTCAIAKADSTAYCWGLGTSGELGQGSAVSSPVPVAATGGFKFLGITAGGAHTCATREDTRVLCWGNNADGQLGDGDAPNNKSTPTPVVANFTSYPLQASVYLAAGASHTCVVERPTFNVWCWGSNSDGQVGPTSSVGSSTDSPYLVLQGVFQVTGALIAGGHHSCAMVIGFAAGYRDGVHCWGRNANGQLGIASLVSSDTPIFIIQ